MISLSGDSSALSNWEYKNNGPLVVLMTIFSSLMAVYLMNLLIGLLSNCIEQDNNRVSYLVQKAKVIPIYCTVHVILTSINSVFKKKCLDLGRNRVILPIS